VPVFRQDLAFEIARNLALFLNLEAGISRNGVPRLAGGVAEGSGQVVRQPAAKDREISRLRTKLATGAEAGIGPENIIWMFGVARTGSSWLASMMGDLEGHAMWYEPYVGEVFGHAYYARAPDWQRGREQFILADRHKEAWLSSIRTFVLEGANVRFPEVAGDGYLIIKEPNGSIGAPLMMEALPESRMIFLIRDPRDVVASLLDANRGTTWASKQRGEEGGEGSLADADPDRFVRQRANMCMRSLSRAKEAYEAHRGYKVTVRYEDLRYETLEELKRIYSTLGIPAGERQLRRVVEKHAWENIPEEKKGTDKRLRKAIPGGWREDLTPEQARVVGEITAPLLSEFYPG